MLHLARPLAKCFIQNSVLVSCSDGRRRAWSNRRVAASPTLDRVAVSRSRYYSLIEMLWRLLHNRNFVSTKVILSTTKSTFVWQNQLLSDKNNFVVDKITFVRQKWLLLDEICFCQQKCACYKRRPIKKRLANSSQTDYSGFSGALMIAW